MKRIIMLGICSVCFLGCMTKTRNVVESIVPEDDLEKDALLTRAEIIKPVSANPYREDYDRRRFYVEIDLNGDGLMTIIISEAISESDRGGHFWSVYLRVSDNQYQFAGEIFGWPLAKEEDDSGCRGIWSYSRRSARSGGIQCLYFDPWEHKFTLSPVLEIRPGDSGTDIGNNIYKTIFNDDTCLPLRVISPASLTNDLPYLDKPYGLPY